MASASEKTLRQSMTKSLVPFETDAGLRILSVLILFATALLIVIAVAGVVIARNLMLRSGPSSSATPAIVEAPKVDAEPKRDLQPAKSAPAIVVMTVEKPSRSTERPNEERDVEREKKTAPAAPMPSPIQTTKLLESLGGLCAVQLYQSYLNVGLLADAVEHETYPKAEAIQILGTITTLSQTVDGQIRKLADAGLEKDDVDSLERVRKASELVRNQAASLQSFWETGEKQHIESYRASRARCWQELQAILGLPADDKN
jgi:hypothetical protein